MADHRDYTGEPNHYRQNGDSVGWDNPQLRPKYNHPSRQKYEQDAGDEQAQFEEPQVHQSRHQETSDHERNIYLEPHHKSFQLLPTVRSIRLLLAVDYLLSAKMRSFAKQLPYEVSKVKITRPPLTIDVRFACSPPRRAPPLRRLPRFTD